MDDIREDLPMSMTMAAFTAVSWYIGLEINISLFMLFRKRRGLYFWACALVSWGVILQPLFIILADFGIWTNFLGAITCIYLTWFIMVVPQSWVLYSRLHLIVHNQRLLWWLRGVLIFNSVVFSVPTIVVGILAQATDVNPGLRDNNIIWDRVQLTVFFVQETILSLLYIYQTRKYVQINAIFGKHSVPSDPSAPSNQTPATRAEREKNRVLWHLILANILIIALDIALLGIQYGGDHLFYLQGSFKPCVYGVKLKVEFLVLNRLINSLRSRDGGSGAPYRGHVNSGDSAGHLSHKLRGQRSSDIVTAEVVGKDSGSNDVGLEPLAMTRLVGGRSQSAPGLERPVTSGDGRLFGKPTEPWDGTWRS